MRVKLTSLRELISEIDTYDEYRPVFVRPSRTIGPKSKCLVIIGEHPCMSDFSAVPFAARWRRMVRFLSTGQLMDVEGTLSALRDSYTEQELYAAINEFYKAHVKR